MNLQQRKAALAKLAPKGKTQVKEPSTDPLMVRVGMATGAVIPTVKKNVGTFWDAVKTGYACAEHGIE